MMIDWFVFRVPSEKVGTTLHVVLYTKIKRDKIAVNVLHFGCGSENQDDVKEKQKCKPSLSNHQHNVAIKFVIAFKKEG